MYNRSYGKRRPPVIPENYRGSAFAGVPVGEPVPDGAEDGMKIHRPVDRPLPPADPPLPPPPSIPDSRNEEPACRMPQIGGKLFPNGLGEEELLILSLILVTSQSENPGDIMIYLILLLFC